MKPSEKLAIMLIAAATELLPSTHKSKTLASVTFRHWCPRLSYPRIANALGWRNHTSVICAQRTWDKPKASNKYFREQMDEYVRGNCMGLVRQINIATHANLEFKNAA